MFFERYCIFSIFSYFLHVTVSSSFLEKKISNHPGVEEALVRGVNVERIGMTLSVSFPRGQPPPTQKINNDLRVCKWKLDFAFNIIT